MIKKLPHVLLIAYITLCTVLAFNPYNRDIWWAENLPIMAIVLFLIATYPFYRFSNTAYILMAFLVFIHTTGGHFTFARTPFWEFASDLFGPSGRNNYDRVGHITVGFYAFAIAEFLLAKKLTNSRWILFLFPIFSILSVACLYEIAEWIYADFFNEAAGPTFLGSQGDVWDAQKDMALDGLGSIVAMILFYPIYLRKIHQLHQPVNNN